MQIIRISVVGIRDCAKPSSGCFEIHRFDFRDIDPNVYNVRRTSYYAYIISDKLRYISGAVLTSDLPRIRLCIILT